MQSTGCQNYQDHSKQFRCFQPPEALTLLSALPDQMHSVYRTTTMLYIHAK